MSAIILENISFSYSSKPLLENISLQVGEGERACLIGPNGCGKTTLLRIASQDLLPEQGKVKIEGTNTEFFQVPAIEHFRGSAGDYLECALCPLRNIATQFQDATTKMSQGIGTTQEGQSFDQLLALMSCFDIWSLETRIAEVLARLGLRALTGSGRDRSLSSMSPGERGRLQLAAASSKLLRAAAPAFPARKNPRMMSKEATMVKAKAASAIFFLTLGTSGVGVFTFVTGG